jgi:hypothetical protein
MDNTASAGETIGIQQFVRESMAEYIGTFIKTK